jgi:hypothetical protein
MSCIKDTPVIAMERLCEEKLKCWVCNWARKVRGQRSREGTTDHGTFTDHQ